MAEQAHALAPHHLPPFIPTADGGDWLMSVMLVALIVGVILLGVFYLHLHSIPERLAHKHGRMQFELVAVLGLLALFTHNNIFWVAALLLAFIQLPDFWTPLESMAHSLSRLAGTGGVSSETLVERDEEAELAGAAAPPAENLTAESELAAASAPADSGPSRPESANAEGENKHV
ncbi:hypothetical protein [Labrenzia sp. VG12]|uniref:hypothetical protein n=1 Tax=Labrenzia sp. VG12 TaxID=2021862 RepID=UPI000B8C629A|nr:hypothetical protein [Labrenzia sp. VG12]ASP32016.1 hypothetical protein CHH27_01155 [Labrenzia sp. VG12]